MGSYLVRLCVYVISFMLSFWALSAVHFEQLCDVRKPGKVQLLLLLMALALGYLVGQFLFSITYYM